MERATAHEAFKITYDKFVSGVLTASEYSDSLQRYKEECDRRGHEFDQSKSCIWCGASSLRRWWQKAQ